MPEGPAGAIAVVSSSATSTARCGAAVAGLIAPGDTVLLSGDMGTGKTTFTQGLAAALGVAGPVTSPTFVLVHTYPTRRGWDLLHADIWRLSQLHEVVDLAIPELLDQGAAAVVEWGEKALPALPRDFLHVRFDFEDDGDGPGQADGSGGPRLVRAGACGPGWQERMSELCRRLEAAVG
jgi:tRNA threonylcarbamoyladenosine biosynthesis protein TsaE